MLKVSNNSVVIRAFMHHEFSKVMMILFSDDLVHSIMRKTDAVLLFNTESELIGVNLLNTPYSYHGYVRPDDSLKNYIEKRLSLLDLDIEIDQKSYFVSGRILKTSLHPDSDHLNVCSVDIGEKTVNIVSSAKNVRENMAVVVALPKAVLPDGIMISESKVAGIASHGMMCSLSEITGGKKPVKGLIELPKSTVCGSVLDIAGLGETLC